MGILLRPRRVERPVLRRWLIEGLKVIGRRPVLWAGVAVICGGTVLLAASSLTALFFIGVLFYLLLTSVAYGSDEAGHPPNQSLGLTVQRTMPVALVYAALLAAVFGAAGTVLGVLQGNPWELWYNPTRLIELSSGDVYEASLRAFGGFSIGLVLGGLATQWLPGTSLFSYQLMAFAGADRTTAGNLSEEARNLNRPAVYFLLTLPFILAIAVGLIPLFAPLVMCFWAAVSYVAYRDIFLGVGQTKNVENTASLQVSVPSAVKR